MEVVSRWLSSAGTDDPGIAASRDLEDVRQADAMVAFTQGPRHPHQGRGGRHVEFGIALGLGIPVIRVGPVEHVFHELPGVHAADEWPVACARLVSLATGGGAGSSGEIG